MGKYSFYEKKNSPRSQPLPVDINEPAELLCKRVGDKQALDTLNDGKENRFHQDVCCYHSETKKLVATFKQHYGIVQNYRLRKYRDDGKLLYDRNIINTKVDMKKPKDNKNAKD